jgi:RNA polymerase sigma-70 factor (ECF subfamily)
VNDLDLAKRIADGDAEAIQSFVARYYHSVYRFMRHLTRHVEDAEDLTQQAFVKARQEIASYRGKASLRTWLHRVALHEYTHWKRRQRKTAALDIATPHNESGYDECLEGIVLAEALQKLSEPLRVAFILFEIDQLSLEEVAGVLRLPKGTVKSRLFKARKKLSELMLGRQEEEREREHALES